MWDYGKSLRSLKKYYQLSNTKPCGEVKHNSSLYSLVKEAEPETMIWENLLGHNCPFHSRIMTERVFDVRFYPTLRFH